MTKQAACNFDVGGRTIPTGSLNIAANICKTMYATDNVAFTCQQILKAICNVDLLMQAQRPVSHLYFCRTGHERRILTMQR